MSTGSRRSNENFDHYCDQNGYIYSKSIVTHRIRVVQMMRPLSDDLQQARKVIFQLKRELKSVRSTSTSDDDDDLIIRSGRRIYISSGGPIRHTATNRVKLYAGYPVVGGAVCLD